jgi:hypothetical protein
MDRKRCTKCDQIKSLSEFNKDSNTRDGLRYWCKNCVKLSNAYTSDRTDKKKCTKCKRVKILSDFGKRTASNDGLNTRCKACVKKSQDKWVACKVDYRKEYRVSRREMILKLHRDYHKAHPEVRRANEAKRKALKKSATTTDRYILRGLS